MDVSNLFLKDAIEKSRYYKAMGESAICSLSDKEIHYRFQPDDNNMATLGKHISGNLLSRWTDFLTTDGEKEWRNRDSEFVDDIKGVSSLLSIWEHGWKCFLSELSKLKPEDLIKITLIRRQELFVLEAVQRQLQHNAYHVGQMVFLAKSIKGKHWKSLSIPKERSKEFNRKMGM